jgi:hypothetical protein
MMDKGKQIMVLVALAVASGALSALLAFTMQSIFIILAVTLVVALVSTIALPIRHDLITAAVGLSSALVVVAKQPGPFSPFVFVILFTVPYIGATIGRDIKKAREQRNRRPTTDSTLSTEGAPSVEMNDK